MVKVQALVFRLLPLCHAVTTNRHHASEVTRELQDHLFLFICAQNQAAHVSASVLQSIKFGSRKRSLSTTASDCFGPPYPTGAKSLPLRLLYVYLLKPEHSLCIWKLSVAWA